jgi:transposase
VAARAKRPPGVPQLGPLWALAIVLGPTADKGSFFTAIRFATGEDVTLALPAANTAAMQVFLDHVAASRPADAHLVLVLDGAGWPVSRALAVPPNITPVVRPPHGPELNPVERVWLHLRERHLSLRLLHSTDALIDARRHAGGASSPTPIGSGPFAATPGSRRSRHRLAGIKGYKLADAAHSC